MNHTKDEITINITKKAKIWLSVILCAILVLTATIILIHRHNYLLSSSTPAEQSEESTTPPVPTGPFIDGVDLDASYLNQVLHVLDDVGGTFHNWFGIYFDNHGIVDKVKANLTESRYTQIENHSATMMQIVERDYYSKGKVVNEETIFDSEDFHNSTVQLKNLLNEAV